MQDLILTEICLFFIWFSSFSSIFPFSACPGHSYTFILKSGDADSSFSSSNQEDKRLCD